MTTMPPPHLDLAGRRRTRAALAAGAAVVLGSTAWWIGYSHDAVVKHEQRVIAGDFPSLRVQTGKMSVDEYGRVAVGGFLTDPPLTSASTRLIPVGKYQAVLVASDGIAEHRKKTELVIGAQDESGAWHPATASAVIERMKAPRVGSPL